MKRGKWVRDKGKKKQIVFQKREKEEVSRSEKGFHPSATRGEKNEKL